MSIKKILKSKDEDSVKLTKVAKVIQSVREEYGNTDIEIPQAKVNTCEGFIPFSTLDDDSKVVILLNEVAVIKTQAIAYAEDNVGIVVKKVVQQLLATNPLFANVSAGNDLDYL
jgi:hypothetical protein